MVLSTLVAKMMKRDRLKDILTVVSIVLLCSILAATISLDAADFAKNHPKEGFTNGVFDKPIVCHPSCCPSEWSCSNGCVCLSVEDKQFLKTRGQNSSINDF